MKLRWRLQALCVLLVASGAYGQTGHEKHVVPEEPRVSVDVPDTEQKRIGLAVALVTRTAAELVVRSVGAVVVDETKEAHVHSRVVGWIERLFLDAVGKSVKRGEPLLEMYSPDVYATEEEYVSAVTQGASKEIAAATLERLRSWGVPSGEIDRLTRDRKARRTFRIEAPLSGVVLTKGAIQGMYVTPALELFHLADLSVVWVHVTLYEADVAAVKPGDPVDLVFHQAGDRKLSAQIAFVYPEIDVQTRTARARVELPNIDGALKPGMFVSAEIRKNLGLVLTVPDDAVIDTGARRIVFVRQGGTRFEPREVKVGPRVAKSFVVTAGLEAGEEVVASAHFLIDAESRLEAALRRGAAPAAGHGGHVGK